MSTTHDGDEERLNSAMLALSQAPTRPAGEVLALQQLVDGIPDPLFFKDRQHRWTAFNQAFCDMLGRPREELYCRSDPDFFPPDQVAMFQEHDNKVFNTGEGDLNEELVTRSDGTLHVLWTRKTPVRDASGAVVALFGIIMDVSDHKDYLRKTTALEAEATRQRAVIEAQERLIDDLVVPVLEVWDGILLLPLVGGLTRGRTEHVVESALQAVSQRATQTVIIDVTGAGILDIEVAELLVRTTRSIRLLGCSSIVVGISPASARALALGGTDLGATIICGTLKQGLALALAERRG